jgi:integrase/recombinase XerD
VNGLGDAVAEYLAIRRALGFKLVAAGQLLPDFAAYAERHGAVTIRTEVALACARLPVDAQPVWWSIRLRVVRGFARYLHALDARHEVPPADLLPARWRRPTPYLYSDADLDRLLQAAGALPGRLRATTYVTLISLLAISGMRVGEAIRLDRADLDWSAGLLVVRGTKFGKSRELVLHPSALAALRAYDQRRREVWPRPRTPAFFVSIPGTRLTYSEVQRTFGRLVRQAGLAPRSGRCRPRLHDLRHTFAVNTVLGWYRAGLDVEARMHALSTYLGHVDPANTYWYLSAAPELLALAGERLERSLAGMEPPR